MPTELQYRTACARALDDLEGAFVVSSASSSQIASASRLINNTSGASTNRYNQRYVYVESGTGIGQQREVIGNSYVPSTGVVGVTPNWTTTPVAGDTFVFTSAFPAVPGVMGADTDYRTLMNRSLALLLQPDTITQSGLADTTAVSLSTRPWLDRDDLIVRFTTVSPVTGRQPVDCSWRGIRFVMTGGTPSLEMRAPFEANADLYLDVWRPGHTWISGAESTAGLAGDATTALPRVADVVLVFLMLAYQVLMVRNVSRPVGNWSAKYADQRQLVMKEHARRAQVGDRTLELAAAAAAEREAA